MRKVVALFAGIALIAGVAQAQQPEWIGNSAVYHVEDATWYNASADWAGSAFQGADLGSINLGGSVTLGGEAQTWQGFFGTEVYMGWVTPVAAGEVQLPYLQTAPGSPGGGDNDWWQNQVGENIAVGAPVGTHPIDVYFRAERVDQGQGVDSIFDSNSGANYVGSFTVVPEPSSLLLGSMGLLGILAARRRK